MAARHHSLAERQNIVEGCCQQTELERLESLPISVSRATGEVHSMLAGFFFISVLIAFAVTKLSIWLCLRRKILDLPNFRSSHSAPIPRIGGTGILAGFCLSLIALYVAGLWGFLWKLVSFRDLILMITVSVGMAIVGRYDDLHVLSPAFKMGLQLPIALLVFTYGISIDSLSLPYLKPVTLGVFALPLTVLWLIDSSNVFNFMDGINGLACGTAVVYGAFLRSLRGGKEIVSSQPSRFCWLEVL